MAREDRVFHPFTMLRLTVREDRVIADVALEKQCPRTSSAYLMKRLCISNPDLPYHSCVNEVGSLFGLVMNSTSLPHVFEHLVIDEQVKRTRGAGLVPAVFVGITEWVDVFRGRAQVQASFTDDLIALRAFRDAFRILNEAVVGCYHDFSTPDI